MSKTFYNRWSLTFPSLVILAFVQVCFFVSAVIAQDDKKPYIGMRMPSPTDPLVPIVDKEEFLGLHMDGLRSPILQRRISSLRRDVQIDSTGENINFREKIDAFDFRLPSFLTLKDYIEARRRLDVQTKWTNSVVSNLGDRSGLARGSGGLRIDIPVEIKSKAFQKIFGGGTVGLDVSGDIIIRGGFRREKRSEVRTALNRGNDTNFKMEQEQRFRVQGHVGEKVTIGVDQDSERTFDFDNNISLKYQGYDDEIIQSIEAGNISLSLPGTRFVTFGGKSNGLFGIKMAATIGNLNLTAIASQEKGEKKKLSLQGGASEEAKRIEDYQYKRGTYYFIDEYYRRRYLDVDEDGNFLVNPDHIIKKIELYKSGPGFETRYSESIRGWAWAPAKIDSIRDRDFNDVLIQSPDTTDVHPENYRGYFLRLEKTEYYVDTNVGYIRMDVPLADGEVLAVAFQDSAHNIRGDIAFDPDSASVIHLRMLKPKNPRPRDNTWDLEWKHVYNLGGRNIPKDGFELRLFYKPSSGDPQETYTPTGGGDPKTWLELFGLDRMNQSGEALPDNLVDDKPNIISYASGELFFPDLQPFDPISSDYQQAIPKDKRVPAIYDTTVQSVINAQSNFYIEVKSQTRASEYRLGMNVIENSEEVTLNGSRLQRGIDYTIDYFTGTLRILNEQATQANANLDVTYESNQIFQIDKKTVMGARAEYGLWDDSFIGATFLYLNERTLEQKIRVGKGPMQNMVWDVNTSLNIKPFFLTRFANLLPFVDTRAPSTIKFEGEIAQINPNPNTRNNENTGDDNGVAYIDDFEAAKRLTPIGIARRGWTHCSPPYGKITDPLNPSLKDRGRLVFYNPYQQVPIKEIWPNRDVNANVAQTTNIMVMEFTPSKEDGVHLQESWNGIQKALSAGYHNQTESKYLEVWVWGDSGTIHLELGQISEDIIPNQRYDTEDQLQNGIRNGLLDDNEDIGLDGMSNNNPIAQAAGGDFWDLNGNKLKDEGEPWSDDDWSYSPSNKTANINYQKVNGTEGNENDYGGRRPDTEDMNGNGDVDLTNNYFSYTLSLRKDHPDTMYIVGASISKETGYDFGWRQYRVPLETTDPVLQKIGNPDLQLIEYVRVWMDGCESSQKHIIKIAEINLVGSEWKELGVATVEEPEKYDADDDSTLTVTEVNTHDNPFYRPPPGVQGAVDRITRVIAKEQALVMNVQNLLPGHNAILQKTFYEAQDYIHYNTLKMFVYGKFSSGFIEKESSKVEVFLRFGSDLNNYYEVREKVYEGWNKNNIEVDLLELSSIKLIEEYRYHGPDSTADYYRKDLGGGRSIVVRGKPALRNIRMLVAGVKNLGYDDLGENAGTLTPFTGEIYLNELRLSNVKKDKGIALRTRAEFAWADLLRINGELDKQDADFHNVATRFGTGDNTLSGSLNASVSIDKFLPAQVGLSIPVTMNYSKSEAVPKYMPGDDAETKALPDSIIDRIKTVNEKKGMSVSVSVRSRSQNFFVKYLLAKLRASYSRNEGNGSNSRTKSSYSLSESGSLDWGIDFGRDNYVRPFKWLGTARLLTKLTDMKLYFSPQNFSTNMNGKRSDNKSLLRTGVRSENSSFIVTRSYQGSMKLIESLSMTISRNYTHDLQGVSEDTLRAQIKDFKLGLLTNVDQNYSLKYNPKIFSWLSPNFTYTVGFKFGYNRQQKTSARNSTLSKTLNASGNLNLTTLAKSIYRPSLGGARRPPAGRQAPAPRRPAPGSQGQGEGQQQGGDEEGEEKKGGISFNINPLKYVSAFFSVFEPINITYGQRNNETIYGLAAMPNLSYQFGLSDTTGVPMESITTSGGSSSANLNRGSHSENVNIGLSSGISLSRNIKLSFNYDNTYSLNASTTTTGQRSESWLSFGDNIDMMFPSWTLRINGVEKLPFIEDYVQRMSIEHGYSGKASETFSDTEDNITKQDKDSQFRPLLGITVSLNNGISMSLRYNLSERTSLSQGFGVGSTKTTNSDLQFTANYSKRSDFRIPLPFLRNMRLKNNIDISLTFSMGGNVTMKSRKGGDFEVTGETSKWFLKPNISYSFSDRVRGGAHYEIGKTHNKLVGDTKYQEFMINVNIAIRGN